MTTSERRWIILGDDGRHVSIGRATDPTENEIARAGDGLRASGLGGWVAILEGGYYRSRDQVSLMMVREIAPAKQAWETAVDAFLTARRQAIAAPAP